MNTRSHDTAQSSDVASLRPPPPLYPSGLWISLWSCFKGENPIHEPVERQSRASHGGVCEEWKVAPCVLAHDATSQKTADFQVGGVLLIKWPVALKCVHQACGGRRRPDVAL